MPAEDPDALPSRSLVLDILRAERSERRGHADALDQKAGLALGFAGVLVTLSNDIGEPWRVLGAIASMTSAALALWSFWPRPYPVLDNVRNYLAGAEAHTELVLVDTLDEMNRQTDETAARKARRLRGALAALAVAVVMLGTGVIARDSGGGHGDQGPAERTPDTSAPAAPVAPG